MTDLDTHLAEIRKRADAATPGPWTADGGEIYGDAWHLTWIGETCDVDKPDGGIDNAEFVAAARSDVPRLLAATAAVLNLHTPSWREAWRTRDCEWQECDHGDDEDCAEDIRVCEHCLELIADDEGDPRPAAWPCHTIAAVNTALDADHG